MRLGMLGSGAVAAAVADFLHSRRLPNVVLDPVVRSSSGDALLDEAGVEVLRTKLIPLCDVMTPNIDEAAALAGAEPIAGGASWDLALPSLREMATGLHQLGAKAVVITGGHLQSANDYLSYKVASGENREEIFRASGWNPVQLTELVAPSLQRSRVDWRWATNCHRPSASPRTTSGGGSFRPIRSERESGRSIILG